MTLEISKETEALLEKVLSTGGFESAEQFMQYSLTRTLSEHEILEDEAFVKRVKAALARSQKDIDEGRIHSIPRGQLADFIVARHKARTGADQ